MSLCPQAIRGPSHVYYEGWPWLSFVSLGDYNLFSSFGASLKGSLTVGPSAAVK